MHAQAWLATALVICVGSGLGVACGSDATGGGAGGAAGSAGTGASVGAAGSIGTGASAGAAGRGDGGVAGAGNGSGTGATGTGNRPAGAGGNTGKGGTAPGSGAATNGSGGRPSPGSGGASGGGSSCPPECLVNNTCVTACGQTPKDYGCCPCPPGTVNARTCSASTTDAGSSKGVSCDPRMILCRRAPPVCPFGQAPMVEGTCYGPCVPIDDCVCQAPEDCPNADEYTCHRSQGRCGPYV